MIKFKDLPSVFADFIKLKIPNVNVEFGKYGELPSITPCFWIFIEPSRNMISNFNSYPVIKQAKITIFAISDASKDKFAAMINSVELIETIESIFFSEEFEKFLNSHSKNADQNFFKIKYYGEQPLMFDNIYADYAVSYLEILVPYIS